ncbi:MAG: Ni/Fe hydrogenase subunit alpha [Elusimicrobiota bacterium]
MKRAREITVRHVTRVEGHGDIHIKVKDGRLVDARWAVVETPRFFEAMLKGMSHDLAPILTARICGICSIGHCLASLRAVERAMDVKVPETARLLRLLAKHGETLQSHALHVFFLSAPDLFKVGSVIPLIKSHPEVVGIAARLKKLGNDACDLIAGRTTHPVSLVVGGLSRLPTDKQIEELRGAFLARLPDMRAAVDLFKTLPMPDFQRETEFVSLKGQGDYPWIGGDLVSSDGVRRPEDGYLAMTNEYKVEFSTSKFAKLSRESFAVGALARFNNNHKHLRPEAKGAAKALGLSPLSHNPFMNNVAQLVECYHVMLESIELLDGLLGRRGKTASRPYKVKAGRGVAAVEVPRGILYHEYELDKKGKVVRANCVIPTTQNHANIHHDLRALAARLVREGKSDGEITLLSEMLVRSYDPCISCSVH